jgi:uncharacterized protein (TIRG00374 family)
MPLISDSASARRSVAGKSLKILLAFLFTGAALWLSFRKLDGRALIGALRSVRWPWVAAALANIVAGVYILGARWHVLLSPRANVPAGPLFRLNILAQFVNIVMPARLGEVVRLFLAARERSLPASFVLGTIGAEKILDVLVFAGLWAVIPASLALGRSSSSLAFIAVIVAASAVLLSAVIRRPEGVIRVARAIAGRIAPSKRPHVEGWIRNALEAVAPLRKPSVLAVLSLWTAGIIANQVLSNYFVFLAFGFTLPLQAGVLVLLAVQAGAVPPSLPGKIGVFEYAVVLALGVYSVSSGAALAYAIVLHLVAYLPKIILGSVFMGTTRWGRPSRLHLRSADDVTPR